METEISDPSGLILCHTIKIEVEEEPECFINENISSDLVFSDAEVTEDPLTGLPVCVLCLEVLQPATVTGHMVNVHKYRKVFLKCWNCRQIFREKNELNLHKQFCQPQKTTKQKPTISNFIKEATEKYQAKICPICLIEINEELPTHLEREHQVQDSEEKPPPPPLICPLCNKMFKSKYSLSQHRKQVHDSVQGSVQCPECAKTFASHKLLTGHLRNVHPRDGKSHTCDECGKGYKNYQSLYQHIKKIHKMKARLVSEK